MKNKRSRQLIREMKQILDKDRGLTVEQYVFRGEEPQGQVDPMEINNPGYDGGKDYFEDGEAPDKNAVDYINQIRRSALDGMKALIDQPNSPTFDLLNKIFTLSNKAVETKDDEDVTPPKQDAPQSQPQQQPAPNNNNQPMQ